MILALFLAASAARITLFDEQIRIARLRSQAVPISLHQRPAIVESSFEIANGQQEGVRAVILSVEDMERFREGKAFRILAQSPYGRSGQLRYRIIRPGDYMLVIDNRRATRGLALVRLKVDLVFDNEVSFTPRVLTPAARQRVILTSIGLFTLVAAWSGWRLRRAIRHRGLIVE